MFMEMTLLTLLRHRWVECKIASDLQYFPSSLYFTQNIPEYYYNSLCQCFEIVHSKACKYHPFLTALTLLCWISF